MRVGGVIAVVAAALVGCSSGQGVGGQGGGGVGGSAATGPALGGAGGGTGGTASPGGNAGGGSAGTGGLDAAAIDAPSTTVVLDGCEGLTAAPFVPPAGNYGHPFGIEAAGDNTCAQLSSGAVACWGADEAGQLGDCSTKARPSPGMIAGISDGTNLLMSMSAHRACAVPNPDNAHGQVFCWGPGPPTIIAGMPPSNGVVVSDDHVCASKTASASLYCWGDNTYGQLGDGTTNSSTTAVAVLGLTYVWENIGSDVTCAWDFKTTSWCWGRNTEGQLGDGTTTSRSMPVLILPQPSINPFPVGRHIFSFDSNSNLYCSGTGACGDGGGPSSVRLKPTAISMSSWARTHPVGSDQTSCLVLGDYSVACWGSNSHGQLGDGTMVDRFTPAAVILPSGVQGQSIVATTDGSSFFLMTSDYALYSWGRNDRGQLGDGTTTDRSTPVLVMGSGTSYEVGAGTSHACSISADWVVQCWGGNNAGQIGDGTFVDRPTPVTLAF